jgi:hypothetical protein
VTAPLPPANLSFRKPNLIVVPKGAILYRFYTSSFDPIFFDLSDIGRLNAPDKSFGVLYAAATPNGAFAETFLRQPGRQNVAPDLIARKGFAHLATTRALTLCALLGPGLAKLGATAEVTHGGLPYDCPQRWSAAIHAHPSTLDGIVYKARHDDVEDCYAVFDRARDAITLGRRITALDDGWFWRIADIYGVGLAP